MTNTGMIRNMDDLGRVVIPREIRETFKIQEGDALEVYIDDDFVCFRKPSQKYSVKCCVVYEDIKASSEEEAMELAEKLFCQDIECNGTEMPFDMEVTVNE